MLIASGNKEITYRSFKHFNNDLFLNDLVSVNWAAIETIDDVDTMIDTWYSMFTQIVDKHAPVKSQRVKRNFQPDWLTSEILDGMKERDRCKKNGNLELYRTLRNKISSLIKESKEATYKSKIETGQDDPRSIWKFFKEFGASSKRGNNDKILGININEEIVTDESVLAETFNDYFVNIASRLKEPITQPDFTKLSEYVNSKIPENVKFELPDIDENFVFSFMSKLDISKSTGLDGIGPRLLKLSSGIIKKSITFIVKKCLETSTFPLSWKCAKVTPLYKNGPRDEINNYRPIPVLPTLSKLIEKFIQKHLSSFLNEFGVIHKSQSGFRPGHSTETALLLMTENWLKSINEGKIVGSVMVDFRKAFDLVDHELLLRKLELYKCKTNFIKLMKSYLNSRSQAVSLGGKMSEQGIVKCGVPQGSILGPLLFLIFINDLPLFIREHVFSTDLYADDTIFYDVQKDIPTIKTNLQRALDCLKEWCRQNGMILNTEKTKIMLLSTRQKRLHIDESILSLTYDNIDLQITTGDKILGINIDQNLQWINHFHAVCKKVSSYIWLLSRISSYLSTEYRLLFYKAYIVPHLNNCNIIWGNSSNYNVSRITKLQKRACNIILGNGYTDFEGAKSVLNVLSFEESLFLNKAKIMYKIAKNIIPPYICDLFHRRSDHRRSTFGPIFYFIIIFFSSFSPVL